MFVFGIHNIQLVNKIHLLQSNTTEQNLQAFNSLFLNNQQQAQWRIYNFRKNIVKRIIKASYFDNVVDLAT